MRNETPAETRLQRGQREMRERNALLPQEENPERLRTDLRVIKRSVREWLDSTAINPVQELIDIARRASDAGLLDVACRAWDSVCKLSYPKLSTVQMNSSAQVQVETSVIHTLMLDPKALEAAEILAFALAEQTRLSSDGPNPHFNQDLPSQKPVIELTPIPAEDFVLD